MGSLVALSLTVEEKEECVLSSNRKDNAAFAMSRKTTSLDETALFLSARLLLKRRLFTFGLASVFQQVFVWNGEVTSLESPPLPVGPFCWVQLPGRWVGR